MTLEKAAWRIKILAILPAAAWYRLIWALSGQTAGQSGALSDRLLFRLLAASSAAFTGADRPAQTAAVELLSFFERKAAHMFLYFVLALLACFALCFFTRRARNRMVLAAAACALLAGLDEYHQTMVPGRSGEIRDVLVDLCGAGIALGFLALPHLAGWCRRTLLVPLPALVPAAVCLLPAVLAALGAESAASPLLAWAALRPVPAAGGFAPADLLASLAPVLWDTAYLAACGAAGVCALLAPLMAGAKPRTTLTVCAAAVLAAAALAGAGGTAHPLAAAGLAALGAAGAGALWGLGTVLAPCRRG